MIDVAGGDKVPRKGGPGITGSDLLVVNKVGSASSHLFRFLDLDEEGWRPGHEDSGTFVSEQGSLLTERNRLISQMQLERT